MEVNSNYPCGDIVILECISIDIKVWSFWIAEAGHPRRIRDLQEQLSEGWGRTGVGAKTKSARWRLSNQLRRPTNKHSNDLAIKLKVMKNVQLLPINKWNYNAASKLHQPHRRTPDINTAENWYKRTLYNWMENCINFRKIRNGYKKN